MEHLDEELVKEVNKLQIVIEPSLKDIKELDVKIQAEMRKMKLRSGLVEEIKQSRAYAAKVQVALNKAAEIKGRKAQKDSVAAIGSQMEAQKENSRVAHRDMSPGFLFSNFPPVELSNEYVRESYSENFGERADTRTQGWGKGILEHMNSMTI